MAEERTVTARVTIGPALLNQQRYGVYIRVQSGPRDEAAIEAQLIENAECLGFPNATVWRTVPPEDWPDPKPQARSGEEVWGWIADG